MFAITYEHIHMDTEFQELIPVQHVYLNDAHMGNIMDDAERGYFYLRMPSDAELLQRDLPTAEETTQFFGTIDEVKQMLDGAL